MRKAVYFIVVIVLLCCLPISCAGSKAQPQLLSASQTTCRVRNNGPTGEVKVIFYQVPQSPGLLMSGAPLCKQWVIFPLAEGEETPLSFEVITGSATVGSGHYYVYGSLPEGARGGSKAADYTVVTDGIHYTIEKASGNILKEIQSPDCYASGCAGGYCFGFRVE